MGGSRGRIAFVTNLGVWSGSRYTGQRSISAGGVKNIPNCHVFPLLHISFHCYFWKLAAFRVGTSAAGKFLRTVWSLLTKRSLPPWGRYYLLAHCCCSFPSSVSCCLWRGGIFPGKGHARGSEPGGSWAKWSVELKHLPLRGERLLLPVVCCPLSPKCASCRSKEPWISWLMACYARQVAAKCSNLLFGTYQAFTQRSVVKPGRPWSTSHGVQLQ